MRSARLPIAYHSLTTAASRSLAATLRARVTVTVGAGDLRLEDKIPVGVVLVIVGAVGGWMGGGAAAGGGGAGLGGEAAGAAK